MKGIHRLWLGIGILVILTPLGLIAKGSAWGEWGADEIRALIGFVPEGMASIHGVWKGIMDGYSIPGLRGGIETVLGYIVSAITGVLIVAVTTYGISKLLSSRKR